MKKITKTITKQMQLISTLTGNASLPLGEVGGAYKLNNMKNFTKTITKQLGAIMIAIFLLPPWGAGGASAQFVTIPDPNFVTWLTTHYPTCMTGNQMDTTCSGIVGETFADIHSQGIHDLTGIRYFDNLNYLNCDSNLLSTLPILPHAINYIYASNNQITALNSLFYLTNLKDLNVNNNQLQSLPFLNYDIKNIDCTHNQITTLPNLSSYNLLQHLDCSFNNITTINNQINASGCFLFCQGNGMTSLNITGGNFQYIDCSFNQISNISSLDVDWIQCNNNQLTNINFITSNTFKINFRHNNVAALPTLSSSTLQEIYCDYNLLTTINTLPNSLTSLGCGHNNISFIGTLPNSLTSLNCEHNNLNTLPQLPAGLISVICGNNNISSFSNLPAGLFALVCDSNNLSCIPQLPQTIVNPNFFDISGNNLTCLPNYIPAMDAATLALPLCAAGNPNGCPAAVVPTCTNCVTIPDPNFVTWLTTNYPTCMTGNQMDTTCSAIVNEDTVIVSGLGIHDLTGIQYFDNLVTLKCYTDSLTSLPSLPSSLIYLDCSNNQITSLPSLPINLTGLFCSVNQINSLPVLPYNLQVLYCNGNLIGNLPILPNFITVLDCSNNQLTALPNLTNNLAYLSCTENILTSLPNLPNSLTYLDCGFNQISTLPSFPTGLIVLNCQVNSLTNLPTLPIALNILVCGMNQITSLPLLPNSLTVLQCGDNQLINLPSLPNTIISLGCSVNQLSNLSTLPNALIYFDCSHNNITCLPQLPSTLVDTSSLNISNNLLTCLPNYLLAMEPAELAMPLCAAGNTNGCAVTKGIVGKIYKDDNSNCSMDATDSTVHNVRVKFYNPITNVFGAAYTAANGVYDYVCNTGTNFVLVDTLNKPYKANCPHPGIDSTVVTTTAHALAQNVNFDIACKNGFDVGVQSINHDGLVFPGQTHTLQVIGGDVSQWYGLNCSAGTSGQVTITVNGPVSFAGVPSGALTPSISGNVYTYNIADFGAINNQTAFKLLLTTNTNAQMGNSICVNANITTTSVENNNTNNNSYLCYNVVNSYDPNYKEVYPTDVLPAYADWFTYTVHFQNTGTSAAININLVDTLDNNLDEQTFEVINYSHYNETTLQNHVVNFRFPNILLPDSASNPQGSQGFVQYRVKPKANMPLGTQIKNTAHIYFDFNAPVVTNTTINHFTDVTSPTLALPIGEGSARCYPNPAKDKLFYTNMPKGSTITISNMLGEVCLTSYASLPFGEVGGAFSSLPKGIYFVRCGNETVKFVKE